MAETFDSLNRQGIAATRADLVTHGSGGLRVVTIASPNLGSNVSSYFAGKFETLPSSKNAVEVMEDTSHGFLSISSTCLLRRIPTRFQQFLKQPGVC